MIDERTTFLTLQLGPIPSVAYRRIRWLRSAGILGRTEPWVNSPIYRWLGDRPEFLRAIHYSRSEILTIELVGIYLDEHENAV